MSSKFKISVLATAACLAAPVFSAEEDKKDNSVEVIEVTGFKGSLLRSLNNKRANDAVSDSIFSEDIGKSADQDIGEALQRVTGVSIQRGEGAGDTEGTTITVRGAGPNLNNISLNGIVLTSNTENQAVDLSAYSSDILNSIEVIKTAAADQDEGSLGANVELKTFRPLDAKEDRRVLEVQGRYDDYAQENDYKISGSFSKKFLDDTLGFYVTGFKETQSSRRDMFFTNEYKKFRADNAIDAATGEVIGKGVTTGDEQLVGYAHTQNGFTLFQNNMERQGFTTSLQWLLSDATEVNFNMTMSDQFRETDDNSIVSLGSGDAYQDQDLAQILDPNDPWLVYDADTELFVKKLDRTARGRTSRLQSGVETKNNIYSIDLHHDFSDNFSMDIRTGYSKTKADDDYYSFLNSNNFSHVSDDALLTADPNVIEPTGYDCTSGQCYIVTGTGLVNFGPGQTGAPGEPIEDNVITTGYNPDDLKAIHLQQAVSRDRIMKDEQKAIYVDFDWQLDLGSLRSLEFGVKYQEREKSVFNQQYWFEGIPAPLGQDSLGVGVSSIRLEQVTDGQTPFGNNFLKDLGYARTNNTDGWWTLNARKAFGLLFENDDVRAKPNLANDRDIMLENSAAYIKANFAFLDEKLTGNVGIRYVESNVNSLGFSSLDFQNNNISARELIKIAEDSSLPACTPEQLYANGVDYADGANLAGGLDANGNWSPIPSQNCYDVDYDLGANQRSRYTDGSKPEDPEQFSSTAENKTDIWLPSLTLNYALKDDMILRFAASKTMARPRIDSLKPSSDIREFVWGDGNSYMRLSNPYLEPLESKNLDLSYEWYFNEGGALTVGLFHKKMTKFEVDGSIDAHWADLRETSDEALTQLNPLVDILIEKPGGDPLNYDEAQAQGINCMEDRRHKWQSNSSALSAECDTIIVTLKRNGQGGTNKGLEIGYNQNFTSLPGFWSGLGTAVNYTFSDSETDEEVGELNTVFAALPMPNISKHTYNISTFWEQNGNLVRLAYNHRTDSLARGSFRKGALWNEGGGQLDLSASYKFNDNISFTFNAVNLTNRKSRQYYTNLSDTDFTLEGNALEGKANKSRTIREWTSGTIYRLGVRATF